MFFNILLLIAVAIVSYRIYNKRREARELRESEEARLMIQATEIARQKERFRNCFRIALTQAELDAMVQPKTPGFDPNTCDLGTWFIYPCNESFPELLSVAHVVNTDAAFARQVGARTSLPTRFANAFLVRVINTDSLGERMRDTDFVVMDRDVYQALDDHESGRTECPDKVVRFVLDGWTHPRIMINGVSASVYLRDTGF